HPVVEANEEKWDCSSVPTSSKATHGSLPHVPTAMGSRHGHHSPRLRNAIELAEVQCVQLWPAVSLVLGKALAKNCVDCREDSGRNVFGHLAQVLHPQQCLGALREAYPQPIEQLGGVFTRLHGPATKQTPDHPGRQPSAGLDRLQGEPEPGEVLPE